MPSLVALCTVAALCLLLAALALALRSGLLAEIRVRTGAPPIRRVTIAYRLTVEPDWADNRQLGTELGAIGLRYHNPATGEKRGFASGSILSEGEVEPPAELVQLYKQRGYKVATLPEVPLAVSTSFPCRTALSRFLAGLRVYPRLQCYIQEQHLIAHPVVEVLRGDLLHIMCPLSSHGGFYVEEMRGTCCEWQVDKEPEDRQEDIKGVDSNLQRSAEAPMAVTESQEMPSTRASAPDDEDREHGEHEDQEDGNDQTDRSCSDSEGSDSPFEELDLETVAGRGELR